MHLIWILVFCSLATRVTCVKPIFDLANNMRLVLVPSDTRLGTIIYRLRAQDADENYPLKITAFDSGQTTKTGLIHIVNTDCSKSVCEADVVLMQPLEAGTIYEFNLEVTDTKGESTTVESKLQATEPLGPFVGASPVLLVSENTSLNSLVESFYIRVNPTLYRGISCKLYPKEAREYFKISNGYQTNLKDISRCELKLIKELDFEAKSAFIMRIVAENAWTNPAIDTRNVAVHELIVEVGDVPDNPPYFLDAPAITRVSESTKVGERILEVSAFDGDYAHPRHIRYGLDPEGLPYSSFFEINSDSGIVTLRKSLQDLEAIPTSPIGLRIFAEEMDGTTAKDQTSVEISIIIDDIQNRKPQFLKNHYVTSIHENSPEGTPLVFEGGLDIVKDLDKGDNGILKLSIVGHEDTFEISPSIINHEGKFLISVKNNKKIDFEQQKQMNFKIVAEEVGLSGLAATADVTVNIIDNNDNIPKFDKDQYDVKIPENVAPGTIILQVHAQDGDSGPNSEVSYTELIGDESVEKSFSLDPNSGQIRVKENHVIDRENAEKLSFSVVASDEGGRTSQATVTVHVEDVNDSPPKFKKRIYQGFMTPDMSRLRNDLQVEASDGDKSGTRNSHILYEIINGNYDKKFAIDKHSGLITVNEPLTEFLPSARLIGLKRTSRDEFGLDSDINPVITLTVRAYDDGIPSLDAEVPVHIFTADISSRMIRFILPQDPDTVGENQEKISDLISTMTGGDAEIQDIQPYFGDSPDGYTQIDLPGIARNPKTVSNDKRTRRSLVDVLLRYPATSVVDMNAVTSKLVTSNSQPAAVPSDGSGFNYPRKNQTSGGASFEEGSSDKTTHIEILEQKNAALFWGMIIIILLIIMAVIILLICYCFPGCYLNKKNRKRFREFDNDDGEIKVLTVKNGDGHELKEARFVEIMKTAKERIKSATSIGRQRFLRNDRVQRLLPDRRDEDDFDRGSRIVNSIRPRQIQIYDPNYQDDSIVIVRDYPRSRLTDNSSFQNHHQRPRVDRSFDELDAGSLARSEDSRSIYYGRRMPTEKGKIFKVLEPHQQRGSRHGDDDIQILRLDEDTRREETFQKIGESEILNIDSGEEELSDEIDEDNGQEGGVPRLNEHGVPEIKEPEEHTTLKRPMAPRRSRSQMDISTDTGHVHADFFDGEFYTAVGPDGKEIILRRYLEDQTPRSNVSVEDRGFLSLAMDHLRQQQQQQSLYEQQQQSLLQQQQQQFLEQQNLLNSHQQFMNQQQQILLQRPQFNGSQRKVKKVTRHDYYTSNEEDEISSDDLSDPRDKRPRRKKHKSTQSTFDAQVATDHQGLLDPPSLSPKHHIRSPILEETESILEAELKSQGTITEDRYRFMYSDPDSSYRFRVTDGGGRASPEPAYTETKASILRRRNTMAKLLQEEEKQGNVIDERLERRLQSRNRHWSLNDLPSVQRNDYLRNSHRKRWISVSNDELIREDDRRARNVSRFNGFPRGMNPKSSQGGISEPRKFSKFIPNRFRQQPDITERYQLYLKPSIDERQRSLSRHHRAHRSTKNVELHYVVDSPRKYHVRRLEAARELMGDDDLESKYSSRSSFGSSGEQSGEEEEEHQKLETKYRKPGPINWPNSNLSNPTQEISVRNAENSIPEDEEKPSLENIPSIAGTQQDESESGISSLSVHESHQSGSSVPKPAAIHPNKMSKLEDSKQRSNSAEVLLQI